MKNTDSAVGIDVIQAAQKGNKGAQRNIYLHFAPMLVRVVHHATRESDLTKDIVQDTFVTAFVSLHQLKNAQALKSWLTHIALSLTRKHFRKEKLKRFLGFERLAHDEEGVMWPNHLLAEHRVEMGTIMKNVSALEINCRNAWTLRHIEEYSLPEIAQSLGCSLATVKRWISSAEETLKKTMENAHE